MLITKYITYPSKSNMSIQTQIKQLDQLLEKLLGSDKIIKNVDVSRLTSPGENFGSIMYKVNITIYDKTRKTEEILNTVTKILPSSEVYRKIFNIQVTYTNEMGFYEEIVPTLKEFQKELGITDVINCFPKCYATRKNLEQGSDVINDDAILVLENVQATGYVNIERTKGFDIETSKLILKDLAQFHAVSLAFKLKKPKEFEKKIKKYCHGYVFEDPADLNSLVKLIISQNKDTAKFVSKINIWGKIKRIAPMEPFATLVHQDLWVNNTMQKFENGKPVSNVFVDFQLIDYGSPASDVFFFLWSSVPQNILEKSLDFLLEYYHKEFTYFMNKHNCDTTPFSYEKFLEEIKAIVEYEISHVLFFLLFIVNGKKGGHGDDLPSKEEFYKFIPHITKEKAWYMIKECHKRGWLE